MHKPTKGEIFDLFYEKKQVNRPGGKLKTKITGRKVLVPEQDAMLKRIDNDTLLLSYYTSLLTRPSNSAPPPRPVK